MPDLAEQVRALIDAVAPPVSADEVRARARGRSRPRSRRLIGAGAVVVAAAITAVALGVVVTRPSHHRPRIVTAPTTTAAPVVAPAIGSTIGTLAIPAIGLHLEVREGLDRTTLQRGPGHDPRTPLPGEPGNVVILGHSTTYTHPFFHLNVLRAGATVSLTRDGTRYEYAVTSARRVDAADLDPALRTSKSALSLVTFAPPGSRLQRLIVSARSTGHVAAHIELPAASVIGGDTMTATLAVDNETGATITLAGPNGCADKFTIALGNDQIAASASFAKICGTPVEIAPGEDQIPLTVISTYAGCTTPATTTATGCPPLPPGSYRATLVGDAQQIPAPPAVAVEVRPRP